ncbi:hypothetical protein Sjap_011210 [Stephania japonica]|uniref:Trimethylguanosine synthase n=1 Tax=Stephania japonica TaxID=461633 RepID=A0AAP0JB41_9MAGN
MLRPRRRIIKKPRRNHNLANVEEISPVARKYWLQRYSLFSLYNKGIQMDEEGWYSVTPEAIAIRQARRCAGKVVIDGFTGVGGNAIQFARMHCKVVAIDIDPLKIELAINNAKIYGVESRIHFVVGDFLQQASSLKADVVFLSPPWGGPSYKNVKKFTLDLLKPKDGYSIFQIIRKITRNIIMFLPRNVDLLQVKELAWLSYPPLPLELKLEINLRIYLLLMAMIQIEENYVQNNLKGITAYFGNTARASRLR